MKTVCRPLDRDVKWWPHVQGKSHPMQFKEPYSISKWLDVGLHPSKPACTNVHLPRKSERCMAVYIYKKNIKKKK